MERLQTTEHFDALPSQFQDAITNTFTLFEKEQDVKLLMIADVGLRGYGFPRESNQTRILCEPVGIFVRPPDWYKTANTVKKMKTG